MNEEDPEFEKTLRAINHYYITQVGICTAALSKLRSAELSDKNIIIRAIMCDMPDCGICADPTAEDYGVDFWVDRGNMSTTRRSISMSRRPKRTCCGTSRKKARNRGVWRLRSSGSRCGPTG